MDNPKEEINSFFGSIKSNKSSKVQVKNSIESYMFITANEFHWSQKDFEESEIPYLIILFKKRQEAFREEERRAKRK